MFAIYPPLLILILIQQLFFLLDSSLIIGLPRQSVSQLLLLLKFAQICLICQSCKTELLHGFFKTGAWVPQSCHI